MNTTIVEAVFENGVLKPLDMLSNELLAALHKLNRADKLRAVQFLVNELAVEEEALLASAIMMPSSGRRCRSVGVSPSGLSRYVDNNISPLAPMEPTAEPTSSCRPFSMSFAVAAVASLRPIGICTSQCLCPAVQGSVDLPAMKAGL